MCWGVGGLDQRIGKGSGRRRLVSWYRLCMHTGVSAWACQ
jgi:hypothetical protein